MSVGVRIAAGLLLVACGCGGGNATPDAAPPDAAPPDASPPDAIPCDYTRCGNECVDTTSDHEHCGDCDVGCSPSQDCDSSDCLCPTIAAPSGAFSPFMVQMDPETMSPTVLGIGVYTPDSVIMHAVVIGFHPTDTPVDTDLDLAESAAGASPFVGFGFDLNVTAKTYRGSFSSVSGTLHLTTRCAAGVAGTMSSVVLQEVDTSVEPSVPFDDPCTIEISSLSFDYSSGLCR